MPNQDTSLATLVIGYGNELRRDDGLGPYVANRIEARALRGVRTMAVHQLTPELAAELATVQVAVFVDARMDRHFEAVEIEQVEPCGGASSLTHHCPPCVLLELARIAYDRVPETWLVHVAGEDFGVGQGLSKLAWRGAEAAVEQIEALLSESRLRYPVHPL